MRMPDHKSKTLSELALLHSADLTGDDAMIHGVASLKSAISGQITFLISHKFVPELNDTAATAVVVRSSIGLPDRMSYLVCSEPGLVFARISQYFNPLPVSRAAIHSSAVIADSATLGPGVEVGPNVVIEAGVTIGQNAQLKAGVFVGENSTVGTATVLMPGVVIHSNCIVGDQCRIHSGAIIGSDGFGYELMEGRHIKLPQIGTVVLENDVEIGANSTLDRARFSRTVVGEGTKIDNLVQIAHNVTIGKHCIIVSQTGISGSTTLEDYVVLGGQAGIAGHITIGRAAKVGGQTGVAYNLPPGTYVNGTPAIPYMLERRLQILHQRLPDLFKRVEALEKSAE